jgi:hypothetical protein
LGYDTLLEAYCHNLIFDPFLLIILFTEKMMKKNDEKQVKIK